MGILEEARVAQVINRMEDARALLEEVNTIDGRFNEKISLFAKKLAGFEKELSIIKEQLNVENLGLKKQS
jgi:hypothetical protein